jgi:DNA-binding CsgD family transcriptional regulator
MTRHQIAEHAGRNRTVIRNLMVGQPHAGQGPATRLRRDSEAALLGVPVSPCAPAPVPAGRSLRAGALVDQTGTVRRLRALMANGRPARELARRLGCHTPSLQIKAGRRVTSSTAAAVRKQLHEVAGPSPRTASLYRNRGYLTPGWWDQDTIDDPCYDPALEQLVTASELDAQERAHWLPEVYRLTQRGLSAQDIASRTGTHRPRVVRARSRLRAVS